MNDHEFDPFIAQVARELKEPVVLDAGFDARVMAALEPEVISLDSRRLRQPWYRRSLAVPAPLAGLAAAAAFAGIAALGLLARQPAGGGASDGVAAVVPASDRGDVVDAQVVPYQFLYTAPSATSVAVIGDFNDWQPTPMTWDESAQGWTVMISLPVGVHEYQFLIDGTQHVTDPTAPQTSSDFGSPNSIVKVTPRP